MLLTKSTKTIDLDEEFEFPDVDRLKIYLRDNYMRTEEGKPFNIKQAMKQKKIGSLFKCFKKERTIFDKGGPGLSLYFNFVKSTIFFFMICTILTIPLQIYNIGMYRISQNPNLKPRDDYIWSKIIGMLTSTTLGVNKN